VFGQIKFLIGHRLEEIIFKMPNQYAPGTTNQNGDADFACDVDNKKFIHNFAHVGLPAKRGIA